ncbi:MAG: hypothetical protein M3Z27_03260 [Actinomycetota bacterium]|nr:hypothetical protein [Actinomycetota bacterium]
MLAIRRTSSVSLALLCLSLCSTALAAHPRSGATYSGTIRQTFKHLKIVNRFAISFKVTGSGRRVRSFALQSNYPIYCQGGGFGTVSGGSAAVSKGGRFRVSLPIIFAPTHQHQGFVIITGAFHAHNRESGRVTTRFMKFAQCGGTSSYSTTAK